MQEYNTNLLLFSTINVSYDFNKYLLTLTHFQNNKINMKKEK